MRWKGSLGDGVSVRPGRGGKRCSGSGRVGPGGAGLGQVEANDPGKARDSSPQSVRDSSEKTERRMKSRCLLRLHPVVSIAPPGFCTGPLHVIVIVTFLLLVILILERCTKFEQKTTVNFGIPLIFDFIFWCFHRVCSAMARFAGSRGEILRDEV